MREPDKYFPFDEWVYLKIYTGYRTADRILKEVLYPSSLDVREQGQECKWFFIRYSDPDFHLRYRIKIPDPDSGINIVETIREGLQMFTATGLVWKIELDTYMPENERYGIHSMKLVEDIFHADSEAFLSLLMANNSSRDARWLFAMSSIDHLMADFDYGLDERKSLLLDLSRRFGMEFGKNREVAQQLSARFREKRSGVYAYLEKDQNEILNNRSDMIRPSMRAEKILRLYEQKKQDVEKEDLLSSIIHMSMNRIFRTNNRLHEMVIYDFLFRYYKSQAFQINK